MNDLEFAMLSSIVESLPEHAANLALPDPKLVEYYKNEHDRIYYIDKAIDDTALDLVKFIIKCNREDGDKPADERKRILIMIDSPGGSVEVLGAILGAIKISKTPVWTCCYCTAYSAAADLLACGHKRFMLPMTSAMFHAGSATYSGSQNEIDKAKKFFDSVGKRINDEVICHANFDNKTIKRMKTDDVYMTEDDALSYGVIDEIVSDISVLD